MADKPVKTGRKQDGTFDEGHTGNPRGRPKGSRNKTTVLAQTLLDGQAEEILGKAVELALSGDTSMLRLCVERLVPTKRDTPVSLQLPEIEGCSDAKEAMQETVKAVSIGDLTPEEGGRIISLLERYLGSAELAELEKRIKKIEDSR